MTAAHHNDSDQIKVSSTGLTVPFMLALSGLIAFGGGVAYVSNIYAGLREEDSRLTLHQSVDEKIATNHEERIVRLEASLVEIGAMRSDLHELLLAQRQGRGSSVTATPLPAKSGQYP